MSATMSGIEQAIRAAGNQAELAALLGGQGLKIINVSKARECDERHT